jgi:hypothetical protein
LIEKLTVCPASKVPLAGVATPQTGDAEDGECGDMGEDADPAICPACWATDGATGKTTLQFALDDLLFVSFTV